MPFRRSPTSWYTPSPDASLHVPSHRASAGARLGRPRRWRQGRPAGRADPAVVLHRRRYRARARGVSARGGRAPDPRVASALDPDLRRAGRLRVRQSGRCPRPWRGDSRNGGSGAGAEGRGRHRRRRAFLPRSRSSRSGAIRSDEPPKDRDFALGLGPVAVTAETFEPDACTQLVRVDGVERLRQLSPAFDWHAAVGLAADRTKLYPGDLVAGPSCGVVEPIAPGVTVEVVVDGIGDARRPRSLRSSYAVPQESSR